MEETEDANLMTGWIREQASLLNKPYGEIQRILLTPSARGHKSLFSKWLKYKKTIPLSRPLQKPTQLYDYSAEPTTPYIRGQIAPELEEDLYIDDANPSARPVVWRHREEGDDRWYIPKEFQNPRGKKPQKKKKMRLIIEEDDPDETFEVGIEPEEVFVNDMIDDIQYLERQYPAFRDLYEMPPDARKKPFKTFMNANKVLFETGDSRVSPDDLDVLWIKYRELKKQTGGIEVRNPEPFADAASPPPPATKKDYSKFDGFGAIPSRAMFQAMVERSNKEEVKGLEGIASRAIELLPGNERFKPKQYRPMTTMEAYDNKAYIDRYRAAQSTLHMNRESWSEGGRHRDLIEKYEKEAATFKAKIDALLKSREIPDEEIGGKGIGGALKTKDLQGLLNASYSGDERVGDFILDKRLSTGTSKVYYNPATQQTVVAHRGTQGIMDWMNNLAYAVGGRWGYEMTSRYKEAEKVQRAAEEAYGTKNLATIGHSQGALQADLLGQRGKEVITLNKPTHPLEKSSSSIQTDIRTKRDPVSIFTDADITIESEGYNPLTEHSVDTLGRLDPEEMIGEGLKAVNKAIHHFKYCVGTGLLLSTPQSPAYKEYARLLKQRNRYNRLLRNRFSK